MTTLRPTAKLFKQAEAAFVSDAHYRYFFSQPGANWIFELACFINGVDGRDANRERVVVRRQMRGGNDR